jgi:asparagine synthase (glutamine-hydrolysing)
MCGIIGHVNLGQEYFDTDFVQNGLNKIAHRGPDFSSFWIDESNKCIFGHTRLSIIDLALRSNQPMLDEITGNCITYNGEIYNYLELRKELVAEGFKFKTDSDTEVILKLYLKYGPDCVNHLDGMFAFGIWDQQNQKLFLARDRVGEKPLYYKVINNAIYFASELPVFNCNTDDVNKDAISVFLKLGYLPPSINYYKNINQVLPGEYLEFSVGRIIRRIYWRRNFQNKLNISFKEATEETDRLINLAVKKRLISDVPLGSLLSGGIDSSLVTAIAAKHLNNIPTFNVRFEDEQYSEHLYARIMAKHVNAQHNEIFANIENESFFKDIFSIYGAPYADSSAVPSYMVCRSASSFVKVALNGDGADEIFGGYSRYRMHNHLGFLRSAKKLTFDVFLRFIKLSTQNRPMRYLNRLDSLVFNPDFGGYPIINEFYSFDEISRFQKVEIEDLFCTNWLYNEIIEAREAANTNLDRLLYFDNKNYLPGDLLVKMDIASMRNSLELRPPFCDIELIDFVNRLPDEYKINRTVGKLLLKSIAIKYIPDEIAFRRKKGFTVPLSNWINNYCLDDFGITNNNLLKTEFSSINKKFQTMPEKYSSKVWSLYSLNKFYESR